MATLDELEAQVASLRRRVEDTEAVLAIQGLKARYGELVDRRFVRGRLVDDTTLTDLCRQASELFTDDGVWDGGPGLGRQVGRAAIAARLSEPTITFSRHFFVKPHIAVDGDRATGRWDLLTPMRRADGSSWWMSGYEDDEYARVDGVWLHTSMTLTTIFLAPVGSGWDEIWA